MNSKNISHNTETNGFKVRVISKLPNLHRKNEADYKYKNKNGISKRVQTKYGEWATAANLISGIGAVTTLTGLALLTSNDAATSRDGIIAILAGRFMDNLDGEVAYRTNTMCRTGEIVDAVTDTTLMAISIPVLIGKSILNPVEGVLMASVMGVKVAASATAAKRKVEMQTSRSGKYGVFASWGGIALHGIAHVANNYHHETAANYTNWTATAINVAGIAISAVAAKGYIQSARTYSEESPKA